MDTEYTCRLTAHFMNLNSRIAFIHRIYHWLTQFSDINYPFNIDKHSIVAVGFFFSLMDVNLKCQSIEFQWDTLMAALN